MKAIVVVVGFALTAGIAACGSNNDSSTTQASATHSETTAPPPPTKTKAQPTTTPSAAPPASKACDTPVNALCAIGQDTFGADLILAQTIGNGGGLQVSYSFSAEPDKGAIEEKMNAAYSAVFDQLGDQFKYVEIAAYPPGSTIDAVGVKYPTWDTSIGSNEVQNGQPPSSYWRQESIDPSL